jgi:hypothetical protein
MLENSSNSKNIITFQAHFRAVKSEFELISNFGTNIEKT